MNLNDKQNNMEKITLQRKNHFLVKQKVPTKSFRLIIFKPKFYFVWLSSVQAIQ